MWRQGTEFEQICYEDEGWYLMVAHVYYKPGSTGSNWKVEIIKPPGSKELFSDDGYLGLTAEDMLISAVEGWKKGNGVQNWEMPDDDSILTGDGPATYELHYSNGVREPGYVKALVCANWDDAIETIWSTVQHKKDSADVTSSVFPCA